LLFTVCASSPCSPSSIRVHAECRRLACACLRHTQQKHARSTNHGVVNPIARPPINAEFAQCSAQWFAIPEIALRKPINPIPNLGLGMGVRQSSEPFAEYISSGPRKITANFYHKAVTYKLRQKKPKGKPLTTAHSPLYN